MFQKALSLANKFLIGVKLVSGLEVGEKRRFPRTMLRRCLCVFVCVCFTCASSCGSVSLFVSPAERKKKKTVLVIE